jgi:hypothetical protein
MKSVPQVIKIIQDDAQILTQAGFWHGLDFILKLYSVSSF